MMKVTLAQLKPVQRVVSAATKTGQKPSVLKKAIPAAAALVVTNKAQKAANTNEKTNLNRDYCAFYEVSF